jgi:predicted GIY-YIG superfamily endonuclease
MRSGAVVYRLYDKAEKLLYVGMTGSPEQRWSFHARDKFWWHLVAQKDVTRYEDRSEAEDAERTAIRTEGPAYNLTLNPNRSPVRAGDQRSDPFLVPLVSALRERVEEGAYLVGHAFQVDQRTAFSLNASLVTFSRALSHLAEEELLAYSQSYQGRKFVMVYAVCPTREKRQP